MASLDSSLKSMESTEQSLRSELQQDLLTQLSVADQQEVDRLNDEIRRLTQENKEAFSERMRVSREVPIESELGQFQSLGLPATPCAVVKALPHSIHKASFSLNTNQKCSEMQWG